MHRNFCVDTAEIGLNGLEGLEGLNGWMDEKGRLK